VDTATPEEAGRVIRDIVATFKLGVSSDKAQLLSFRWAASEG
jgi:hypothetical protein